MHLNTGLSRATVALTTLLAAFGLSPSAGVAAPAPIEVTPVDPGRVTTNGDGSWIEWDLGRPRTLSYVALAVPDAEAGRERFDLQLSLDGSAWTNRIENGVLRGTASNAEAFDLAETRARYVRCLRRGDAEVAPRRLVTAGLFAQVDGGPDDPFPGREATVQMAASGRLEYSTDAAGDTIPDFSRAGYGGGGVTLPFVPAQAQVAPVAGDDGANIQAALDAVGALPPDASGFRGAVQLAPGTYEIAGQLLINKSGVVLRGSGNSTAGTVLEATGAATRWLIRVGGTGRRTEDPGTRVAITDAYVPVGSRTFSVADAAGYTVGDRVIVERGANQEWIDTLGMDSCLTVGTEHDTSDVNGSTCLNPEPPDSSRAWAPESYVFHYERRIVALSGNTVTVSEPMVIAIDARWGGGSMWKYTYADRIEGCGVEDLYANSDFTAPDDERHAYGLVNLVNVENAWVRNVSAVHFYHGVALAGAGAAFVTVADSTALDPVAASAGGRMYPFHLDDAQMTLVVRAFSRGARHDFVTGSAVPGPNVFLDGDAVASKSEMGPHHRFATGTLWDDLTHSSASGASYQGVVNRGNSGSGHGWAGAQQVFWNNVADQIRVFRPPTAHNWAFGCRARAHDGDGEYVSWGTAVTPWSLYVQQLRERRGDAAVANIGY
jgi:hypothetical protein